MFNKMFIASAGSVAILASFSAYGMIAEGTAEKEQQIPSNNTVWTEVPIDEGAYKISATYHDFHPKELISEADYVFSGTVVDRKEYEVQWTDENGEKWGPYPSSVIEVKVDKEYYGNTITEGDTIKVYFPNSLSALIDGAFQIKDDSEFIFITRALDEEFVDEKMKNSPYDKFEQEKYADVYISNSRDNIINISDDIIAIYQGFFENNKYKEKSISNKDVSLNNVITSDIIEGEEFVFFNKTEFEEAFSKMLEEKS